MASNFSNKQIREKINEKLNAEFDDIQNLKSLDSQYKEGIEEKERIIENLEIETSDLSSQVLTLEKEKSMILDELNHSKWLTLLLSYQISYL